mgnify:CR=1 FL=1
MTKEEHEFFSLQLKKMNALALMLNSFASEFSSFRTKMVQYDIDAKSLEGQIRQLEVRRADAEKMLRERKAMAEAGTAQIRDQLPKRHLELVERESKIKIKEVAIAEQQKKADELLVAAELQSARYGVENVVSKPVVAEPVLEKRGPGRPKAKVEA